MSPISILTCVMVSVWYVFVCVLPYTLSRKKKCHQCMVDWGSPIAILLVAHISRHPLSLFFFVTCRQRVGGVGESSRRLRSPHISTVYDYCLLVVFFIILHSRLQHRSICIQRWLSRRPCDASLYYSSTTPFLRECTGIYS